MDYRHLNNIAKLRGEKTQCLMTNSLNLIANKLVAP